MTRFVALQILFLATGLGVAFSLPSERQAPECTNDDDCYPPGVPSGVIPLALVSCSSEVCVCNECFLKNSTYGHCETMPPCTDFNETSSECIDNRQSQLTAFLLAFFLTWVGAANFYIGQLALAIPQLLIGIVVLVMGCVQRVFRALTKDKDQVGLKVVACSCGIFLALLSGIQFAWWLADVIIFGINSRPDGNGCPLVPNL